MSVEDDMEFAREANERDAAFERLREAEHADASWRDPPRLRVPAVVSGQAEAQAAAARALGATSIPTPSELEARKSALAGLKVDEQVRAIVAAMNRDEGACPRLPDLSDEAARQVRERMRKQGWDCNLDATRVWWRPL